MYEHIILIVEKGDKRSFYGCGDNSYGQLGMKYSALNYDLPIKIRTEDHLEPIDVAFGRVHTVFIAIQGVYVCGDDRGRQLGFASDMIDTSKFSLRKLQLDDTFKVQKVCCGSNHTLLKTTGGLFGFGRNECDQLGIPSTNTMSLILISIEGLDHTDIIDMSAGSHHSVLNTTKGLYVAGNNRYGEIGFGDKKSVKSFSRLDFNHEIKRISCGHNSTFLTTEDKTYICGKDMERLIKHRSFKRYKRHKSYDLKVITALEFEHEIYSVHAADVDVIFITSDGPYFYFSGPKYQMDVSYNNLNNGLSKLLFKHNVSRASHIGTSTLLYTEHKIYRVDDSGNIDKFLILDDSKIVTSIMNERPTKSARSHVLRNN